MKARMVIAAIAASAVLGGCSVVDKANESRGRGDAGISSVDDTPKEVIQMPDRFSNVATACDNHGHRIYVTTKSDQSRFMAVIADAGCGR